MDILKKADFYSIEFISKNYTKNNIVLYPKEIFQ